MQINHFHAAVPLQTSLAERIRFAVDGGIIFLNALAVVAP